VFIQLGQRIAGEGHSYQNPLAERLGLSIRMVKEYASGNSRVPMPVELLMKELLNKKAPFIFQFTV